MKRIALFTLLALLVVGVLTLAAAPAVTTATCPISAALSTLVGEQLKLDSKHEGPFNVNLVEWFTSHRPKEGEKVRLDVMFQTPRVTVVGMTHTGGLFPLHYHTRNEEIVIPIKGSKTKEWVDEKWQPLLPGSVHYNPRGIVHGGDFGEESWVVLIFTPGPGDDRQWAEGTKYKAGDYTVDWKLVDTQFMKGAIIDLQKWAAEHPIAAGQGMRADFTMGTPRNQMVVGQKPALGPHHHGSADEIIYVQRGAGEMYINGQWVKVTPGTIHFNARGYIHGIRPTSDDFLITALFTPPPANGSDRIFVTELK